MPTVRFDDQAEGEGEGVGGAAGAGRVSTTSRELTRVTSNLTLSDHIGRFVAGEVNSKFKAEDLANTLKGKNAIHVSISWG
jgi:hypothetical protein